MSKPLFASLALAASAFVGGAFALNGCASILGDFEVAAGDIDGGGGGDTSPPVQCTSSCGPEGATQCAMGGKALTCTKGADGCLAWSAPADCPANKICCATACAPVDVSNCYACGTTCSGATPRCLAIPKKCGCSVAVCAATSQGCSLATGACEACTALPAGATNIFVDASSFGGGTGTEACPLKTITAALAKAEASAAAGPITIHVAAGLYNTTLGEVFPLKLRGKSITLMGDGAAKTTIQGAGQVNHGADGGQFNAVYNVTMLVGDAAAKHQVTGLTLRAEADAPTGGYFGVFCDRGNALSVVSNPPAVPSPEANLVLDGLTVGPGYDRGVIVSNSTKPDPLRTGCNAAVTGSTFTGSFGGVWAVGGGYSAEPGVTVSLRVGGKAAGAGNTFTGIKNPGNTAPAVEAWDGVAPVILLSNTITSSNGGFALVNHARQDAAIPIAPYYEIEGNTMTGLSNFGIGINQSMVVEKLNDNVIMGISSPVGAAELGVGIRFDSGGAANVYNPIVKRARGNKIIGNDIGILFRGKPFALQPDNIKTDFGTNVEDGMNVIGCNSTAPGGQISGYDIYVTVTSMQNGGEPAFAGNIWDHKPTSTATGGGALTNGTDLAYSEVASTPSLNVLGAMLKAGMCPAGHVP